MTDDPLPHTLPRWRVDTDRNIAVQALTEIARRRSPLRNPDGDDQYAEDVQGLAEEALAAIGEPLPTDIVGGAQRIICRVQTDEPERPAKTCRCGRAYADHDEPIGGTPFGV